MRSKRYTRYLQSDAWRAKRAEILARADGWCEKCKVRRATQIHHKTYARLGDESPSDLLALCAGCHHKEHPDKYEMGVIYVVDFACFRCPSTSADLYLAGPWKHFVCHGCGEATKEPRERTKRKARVPQRRVPCPECSTSQHSHEQLFEHMQREHPDAPVPLRTCQKHALKIKRIAKRRRASP